jgi:hypothetical protein
VADLADFEAAFDFNARPQLAQKAASLAEVAPHEAHTRLILFPPNHIVGISTGKPLEKGR